MKLFATFAALALCSAAAAAPISGSIENADSSSQQILLMHDLGFNSEAVEQSIPEEPQDAVIATDIPTDAFLTEDELAAMDTEDSSVPASEPPPVTSIALGLTFLGAAGFIRRTRTERRRSRRRRVVHMRAIIAR